MRSFAAVTFALAGLAAAQIDPATVPKSLRTFWCQSQITACPLICLQLPGVNSAGTQDNDCDPDNLAFSCVCENGQTPNASEYSQTVPYFICTQTNTDCVNACAGSSTCQSACRQNHPCGATDPKRYNLTSTSSTMKATGTSSGSVQTNSAGAITGFGGAAPTSDSSTNSGAGPAMLNFGMSYGLAVVASGIVAGFALML